MTINGKLYSNILLVFALESEAGKEFESFNKLFVGVGKIKATYHLVKVNKTAKGKATGGLVQHGIGKRRGEYCL